jgi:type VI protein secretion system component Hcp
LRDQDHGKVEDAGVWFAGQLAKGDHTVKNDRTAKPATNELNEADLEKVTGGKGAGKAHFHDFSITHVYDKASPVLM